MQMRQTRDQISNNLDNNPNQFKTIPPTAKNPVLRDGVPQSADSIQNPNFPEVAPAKDVPQFSDMFKNAINQVNAKQMESSSLQTRFTKGDPMVDLPEVMIAAQKSSVAFQAMTQVRNKLVEAYKDIMNMPV